MCGGNYMYTIIYDHDDRGGGVRSSKTVRVHETSARGTRGGGGGRGGGGCCCGGGGVCIRPDK